MSKSLVLYADDDADDRMVVTEAFQELKEEIDFRSFADGIELVRFVNADASIEPCLIILDINMPKLDGKDTLRLLRSESRFATTPIILFTTSSLPNDSYFAQHYKAGFVTKPIDFGQMATIVKNMALHCLPEEKKAKF